jgi:hypothetical protein
MIASPSQAKAAPHVPLKEDRSSSLCVSPQPGVEREQVPVVLPVWVVGEPPGGVVVVVVVVVVVQVVGVQSVDDVV